MKNIFFFIFFSFCCLNLEASFYEFEGFSENEGGEESKRATHISDRILINQIMEMDEIRSLIEQIGHARNSFIQHYSFNLGLLKIKKNSQTFFDPGIRSSEFSTLSSRQYPIHSSISVKFDDIEWKERLSYSRVEMIQFDDSNNVFKCGKGSSPFWLTVSHELIHYLHFLENPEVYFDNITGWHDGAWSSVKNSLHWADKWGFKKEEQITVIGTETSPERVSELTLRNQSNIPIRYAYQSIENDFYEEKNLLDLIVDISRKDKNILLYNHVVDFYFDEEKATQSFQRPREKNVIDIRKTNMRQPPRKFLERMKKYEE